MGTVPPSISRFGKWMALTAALLGWLFDGLEMGLFPLVARPALLDLLTTTGGERPTEQQISAWLGIITALFLVGAATGGVLFGWIGDRFGRVRAMMLSVLTYAVVSGLCGFASSAWQIGVLRFIAALGMGGEWSLGVALVTELWPDRSRAFLAGLVGAAGNVGYLLIAVVGLGLGRFIDETRAFLIHASVPADFVDHVLHNGGWRFLMMLAAAPALLVFFIRLFVPESDRWRRERDKGTTGRWVPSDLIGVLIGGLGAAGIVAAWAPDLAIPLGVRVLGSLIGFAVALVGYTYPVRRFLARSDSGDLPPTHRARPTFRRMILAACLSGVALLGTWGSVQQAPAYAGGLIQETAKRDWRTANEAAPPADVEADIRRDAQRGSADTQVASALGAVLGTILAAWLAERLNRRLTYFALCVGSLAVVPGFYLTQTAVNGTFFILAFFMGAITASFYGWLPLFLPENFRTEVRATGQGFAFNFGRIVAAIGVLQLGNLAAQFAGGLPMACASLSAVYLCGMGLIWLAPETKGMPLPE
jgi:SHS family sialic acid transporter-like MFS transporter